MLANFDFTIPSGGQIVQGVPGSFIRLMSATVDAGTSIQVGVRSGNGSDEVLLQVGQGIRLSPGERVDTWRVKNRGSGNMTGVLLIGDGDFSDQVVNVGGTLAISSIAGTTNVAVTGVATVQENQIAVTGTWSSITVNPVGFIAIQIFAPAANTNGVIIQNWDFMHWPGSTWALIAKSGAAPATVIDGDVMYSGGEFGAAVALREALKNKTKIAAGKGLYFVLATGDSGGQPVMRSLAYSAL